MDGERRHVIGVFKTQLEWLDEARKLAHPFDSQSAVPRVLHDEVVNFLTSSPDHVVRKRSSFLRVVLQLKKELEKDEAQLHLNMERGVADVCRGKSILLWQSLLRLLDYPDLDIIEDFKHGVRVVGIADSSPIYPRSFKPAVMSENELLKLGQARLDAGWVDITVPDVDLQRHLWEAGLAEVDLGWLEGPT